MSFKSNQEKGDRDSSHFEVSITTSKSLDLKNQSTNSKLDWFQVLAVCLIVFGDTFARAVIIPFLPFLVYDFGLTDDLSKVGMLFR